MRGDRVLGGWQISGIENWSTGTPVVLGGVDNGTTAEALWGGNAPFKQRPSWDGVSAKLTNQSYSHWFNTNSFSVPLPYVIGNAPRTLPDVNNPSYQDLDLQIAKDTSIAGNLKTQFRLEMFNAFNHPVLGNPDANVTDSTFGKISGYANQQRRLQVAVKVNF